MDFMFDLDLPKHGIPSLPYSSIISTSSKNNMPTSTFLTYAYLSTSLWHQRLSNAYLSIVRKSLARNNIVFQDSRDFNVVQSFPT